MPLANLLLLTAAIVPCDTIENDSPDQIRGAVRTSTAVTVTPEGETTVITNQIFTQSADSVVVKKLETTDNAADPDTGTPDLFSPITFEEAVEAAEEREPATLARHKTPDQIAADNRNWLYLLKHKKLSLRDKTVEWPRGIRPIINVINAVDGFINNFDTTYVCGTGYSAKFYISSENWVDSYAMNFNNNMPMRVMSDLTSTLAFSLQAFGIGYSYTLDMSHILANRPQHNKKWEFSVNTGLFSLDLSHTVNEGGSFIRTFDNFNSGHVFKMEFPGVKMSNYTADLYFFVNNRRYSQAAAYNYSKIQRHRAGSIILGLSYSNLNMDLDFSTLPSVLKPYLKIDPRAYRFHYQNYCLLVGYGYSWVFGPHFTFNLTGLPSLGWNHCYEDSVEGAGNLFSMNIKARLSLVYNNRNLFAGLRARIDGHWYRSYSYSFFNSVEFLTANIGIRF